MDNHCTVHLPTITWMTFWANWCNWQLRLELSFVIGYFTPDIGPQTLLYVPKTWTIYAYIVISNIQQTYKLQCSIQRKCVIWEIDISTPRQQTLLVLGSPPNMVLQEISTNLVGTASCSNQFTVKVPEMPLPPRCRPTVETEVWRNSAVTHTKRCGKPNGKPQENDLDMVCFPHLCQTAGGYFFILSFCSIMEATIFEKFRVSKLFQRGRTVGKCSQPSTKRKTLQHGKSPVENSSNI